MEDKATTALQKLTVQDTVIFEWAEKCSVTDADSKRNAENLLIGARAAEKRAKATQAELLEPIRESEKKVRALFKPYLEKLSICIGRLNTALDAYHAQEAKAAQEEQNRIMAEQAHKVAEARETGEVVELPTVTILAGPAKTSRPDMGAVTYRDDYDIQIVQPDLVPRDLCDPSMTKIRKRVQSGVKDIPGVLITPKYTTATKVR